MEINNNCKRCDNPSLKRGKITLFNYKKLNEFLKNDKRTMKKFFLFLSHSNVEKTR